MCLSVCTRVWGWLFNSVFFILPVFPEQRVARDSAPDSTSGAPSPQQHLQPKPNTSINSSPTPARHMRRSSNKPNLTPKLKSNTNFSPNTAPHLRRVRCELLPPLLEASPPLRLLLLELRAGGGRVWSGCEQGGTGRWQGVHRHRMRTGYRGVCE